MDDSVQVCNCNGVSKGDLVACVRGGRAQRHGRDERHPGRQGLRVVQAARQEIVEWAVDRGRRRARRSTRAPTGTSRRSRWTSRRSSPRSGSANLRSVSAVFAALAPDGEDAGSKMPLTSLLRVVWNGEFVNENDAKFINDRVHANIQRDGTFSVVRADQGRRHHRRRAAAHRGRRGQVRDPDDQDHRRAADRPARRAQGGPARRCGRTSTCPRATRTASRSAR